MIKNKTPSHIKEFIKTHYLILSILILLPVIGVVAFCIAFKTELCNAGAWGSIIAGVFTYCGTTTLGVFTFFHTWQQEKMQAESQEVKFSLDLDAFVENGYFVPYSIEELKAHRRDLTHKIDQVKCSADQIDEDIFDWNFLGFTLKNINHLVNFKVKFIGLYYVDKDHKVQSIKSKIKIWETGDGSPIDYKQTYSCYVGCDAKILTKNYMETKENYNWFIVFSTIDDNQKVKYVICDYVLGQTLGISKSIISEKDYRKRIKAHDSPIELTTYHKQFFEQKII